MLNTIQQEKAVTYLRYALADLEGLLEDPYNDATREVAGDTVNVIREFLNRLNKED